MLTLRELSAVSFASGWAVLRVVRDDATARFGSDDDDADLGAVIGTASGGNGRTKKMRQDSARQAACLSSGIHVTLHVR